MKFVQFLKRILFSKTVKGLAIAAGFLIFILIAFGLIFDKRCSVVDAGFAPIETTPASPELLSLQQSIEGYFRTEETTYITFPEWYLVFAPQEYARFLKTQKPSAYPYFASIEQFWGSYCRVYGISKKHYPFNAGNQAVEAVIGVSFTAEFIVKGLYENTIGRITEIVGGYKSDEDAYAAEIAQAYGEFIPNSPWYEFPYGKALIGVWTKTSFFGFDFARKTERKLFLSLEYGVKAVYAQVIRAATRSAFGVASTQVYATVNTPAAQIYFDPRVKKIRDLAGGKTVIALPHYQGFTDVLPSLARKGVRFIDVSGNNEILMSAIVPSDFKADVSPAKILFRMEILTDETKQRLVMQVPVAQMTQTILKIESEKGTTEHLFDY
jgi:hypothetical protein